MDTLAHGLWGGATFGQEKKAWKWAFLLGMAPDLLSFGPFFLTRLGDIGERLSGHRSGPPDPSTIPAYVYHAYNVTHSLVVWAVVCLIAWAILKYRSIGVTGYRGYSVTPLLPLGAWALHILCDIPTHSTQFFPTPFLWPLPTPFYDGIPWSSKSFMVWNYSMLGVAYLIFLVRKYRSRRP